MNQTKTSVNPKKPSPLSLGVWVLLSLVLALWIDYFINPFVAVLASVVILLYWGVKLKIKSGELTIMGIVVGVVALVCLSAIFLDHLDTGFSDGTTIVDSNSALPVIILMLLCVPAFIHSSRKNKTL